MALPSCVSEEKVLDGFTEKDAEDAKSYFCVNRVGQKVMCHVAQAMYAHDPESEHGTKTLDNYLKNILNFSGKKIRNKVTKMHTYLLKENLMEVQFDIPFSYVLMTFVCEKTFTKLSTTCIENIENLKKLRDKTCHNYGINVDIVVLENMFDQIYKGVSEIVKIDLTYLENGKEELRSIKSTKVSAINIANYMSEVRRHTSERKLKIIENGRNEVKIMYNNLQVHNPCLWITSKNHPTSVEQYHIDEIFTPLKTKEEEKEVTVEELFAMHKKSGDKDGVCSFLLYGDAGCGKTTICHYVIRHWCDEKNIITGLNCIELLIFVDVRMAKSHTLVEFLTTECLIETCKEFEDKDIVPALQDISVFFVIDGFDEAKRDSSFSLVKDIINKFNKNGILLTTRKSHFEDALTIARNFRVKIISIETCCFDEKRLQGFTKKIFKDLQPDEKKCQEEIKYFQNSIIELQKKLDNHIRLPINVYFLILLWRKSRTLVNKIENSTCLYYEIFRLCKEEMKMSMGHINDNDLETVLEELQICLGQQAWNLLVETTSVCPRQKEWYILTEECKGKLIEIFNWKLAYFSCDMSIGDTSVKPLQFAFLHKSQMEFLAGAFLASSLINNALSFDSIDKFVCTYSEWSRHQEVLKFLAGCLACKNFMNKYFCKEIMKLLENTDVKSEDFIYWWNFYIETRRDKEVGFSIIEILPKDCWNLIANHVTAGLELYYSLKIKNLKMLIIDIPAHTDPYSIGGFFAVMKRLNQSKAKEKTEKGKFDPIMVELNLWHHYKFESGLSDDLIRQLHPWGYLVSFVGSLGHREVLQYSNNLKTINVRLNSKNAVKSFVKSFSKIYKNVDSLNITLGSSLTCVPSELSDLEKNNKVKIILAGTANDHTEVLEYNR